MRSNNAKRKNVNSGTFNTKKETSMPRLVSQLPSTQQAISKSHFPALESGLKTIERDKRIVY